MRQMGWLAVVAPLTSCASTSTIDTQRHGALPSRGAYVLVDSSEIAPSTAASAITSRLDELGFTKGAPAQYAIQFTEADLPGKAGLYIPDRTASADEQAWLASPTRSKSRRVGRLAISFTDMATGREIFRVDGEERYRAKADQRGDELIQSVLSHLR